MSSLRVSSRTAGPSGHGRLPYTTIRTNPPPPEEWTLVKEYNIEKRDNFMGWQRQVALHLEQMRNQLLNYSVFINMMDEEIDQTRRQWQANSQQNTEEETDDCADHHEQPGGIVKSDSTDDHKNINGMKEMKLRIAQEQ